MGAIPLCKILVVDDSHAAADSLCMLLTLKGHGAQVAYTGAAAIQSVAVLAPDVVLLDIGLTDMTGHEVAKRLRVGGYKNKIVALSGYGEEEDRKAAFSAGCDHHFTKPMAITHFEEYLVSVQST